MKKHYHLLLCLLVLGTTVAITSCNSKEDPLEPSTVDDYTLLGEWTQLISDSDNNCTITFTADGIAFRKEEGCSTEKLTYHNTGNTTALLIDKDLPDNPYKITLVEKDLAYMTRDEDSGDVDLHVLYRPEKDMGKPNTNDAVGTWTFTRHDTDDAERVYVRRIETLKFDKSGKGTWTWKYRRYSTEEFETGTEDFTWEMKNKYMGSITYTETDEDYGGEVYVYTFMIINGKMFCNADDLSGWGQ